MAAEKQQVAIVVGASSGIGRAIALRLAELGYSVGACARRKEKLLSLKKEIEEKGEKCEAVPVDVTVPREIERFIDQVEASLGAIDVCVCCAGIMHWDEISNNQHESWSKMIDVNCKGVCYTTGAVLKGMKKRKSGFLIYISSDAGRSHFEGLTVYSATKHFVEVFVRGVRKETAEFGIRVLSIQPGDVKTSLGSDTPDSKAADRYGSYLSDPGLQILQTGHICGAVEYALNQPKFVAVNEILIEPQSFPLS